jgi:hypothetical protein
MILDLHRERLFARLYGTPFGTAQTLACRRVRAGSHSEAGSIVLLNHERSFVPRRAFAFPEGSLVREKSRLRAYVRSDMTSRSLAA